jgi:hypothetical protein
MRPPSPLCKALPPASYCELLPTDRSERSFPGPSCSSSQDYGRKAERQDKAFQGFLGLSDAGLPTLLERLELLIRDTFSANWVRCRRPVRFQPSRATFTTLHSGAGSKLSSKDEFNVSRQSSKEAVNAGK